MPADRTALFEFLDQCAIAHETVEHEAVFTVDEGREIKARLPGGHTKNLFLKDKKGGLRLVSAIADTAIDIVALGKALGARGRYSFAREEALLECLGVRPGSVSFLALINARPDALPAPVLDQRLFDHDRVWFHPLENTASTAVRPADLLVFSRALGFDPQIIDFASLTPQKP